MFRLFQVRAVLMLDSDSMAFFTALAAVTGVVSLAMAVLLTVFRGKAIIVTLTPSLGLVSCLGIT